MRGEDIHEAWCVTGELVLNSSAEVNNSRVGPVEIYIDDAVIEVENQIAAGLEFDHPLSKNFVYLPDPEIFSIDTEATTVRHVLYFFNYYYLYDLKIISNQKWLLFDIFLNFLFITNA